MEKLEEWAATFPREELQILLEGILSGKCKSDPFPPEATGELKRELDRRLKTEGWEVSGFWQHPMKAHVHFSRLGCFLGAMKDLDFQWLVDLPGDKGVPLGVAPRGARRLRRNDEVEAGGARGPVGAHPS